MAIGLASWLLIATADARDSLVMGGDPRYAPYHFIGPDGPDGFDVELMRTVAERAGFALRVEFDEWGRVQQRLEGGDIDVVPMFVSDARSRRFLFTEPLLVRYHLVFGHSDSEYIGSLEALRGRRVAVQHAGLAAEALQAIDGVEPHLVDVEADAVRAVVRGDADYALLPAGIGYHTIAGDRLDSVVAISPPFLERSYALAVRADRVALRDTLDAALREVRRSGEHDRLYLKWLGRLSSGTPAMPWLVWLGLPMLALVVLVAARSWTMRRHAETAVDAATGLQTRSALARRLRVRRRTAEQHYALLRINLLGLEIIENIAGEAVGDQARRAVAERLRDRFGFERLAAAGPGSLLLVIDGIADADAAGLAWQCAAAAVQQPILVGELPMELHCRIGIALHPEHGEDFDALVRAASLAGDAAQRDVAMARVYQAELEPDPRQLTLMTELRQAIAQGELGYALQPKIGLAARRCIGAELLVRWQHPRHGALSPGAFVPLAEQVGVIGEMSLYLIRRAIVHCREWQQQGWMLSLSVNVSANDLADPAMADAIVADSRGVADRLILEVTETDVMHDPSRVVESTTMLRRHGIRISVDDFGTGHSSLANLQRLSPDELKIDQSFVTSVRKSQADQAIVRATIKLAHELGAEVTAEGIEDDLTLEWLSRAGCDIAQGFLLGMPMTVEQFELMVERQWACSDSERSEAGSL